MSSRRFQTFHNRLSARCVMIALGVLVSMTAPARGEIDVWIDPGHGGPDPGNVGINGDAAPNEEDLTST